MNFFQRVLMAAAITFVIIIVSFEESSEPVPSLLPRSEVKMESKVSILEKCDLSSASTTTSQPEACLGTNEF